MFAYCENNPVNMVDPSGCAPMDTLLKEMRDCILGKKPNTMGWTSVDLLAVKQAILGIGTFVSPVDHAAYGASRSSGKAHNGVDYYPKDSSNKRGSYGADGTPKNVYAMTYGVVIKYISNFYAGTSAIVVDHGNNFIAVYGEIETGLRAGDIVVKGQKIGKMKLSTQNTLMLHLGVYNGKYGDKYQRNPTFTYSFPDRRR